MAATTPFGIPVEPDVNTIYIGSVSICLSLISVSTFSSEGVLYISSYRYTLPL